MKKLLNITLVLMALSFSAAITDNTNNINFFILFSPFYFNVLFLFLTVWLISHKSLGFTVKNKNKTLK
jgi:uncharacterized membrane protein YdbT with pleckstrin-like domain